MKLAVFFPGIGYHCDKPLLYYAKKLTQQCRYEECISLSYSYDGGKYSLQGTTQGNGLTGGVPPVRFSM